MGEQLEVGDLVWEQMYSPIDPAWMSTLEERIADGRTYGRRRQMTLVRLHRDGIDGPCPDADADGLHPLSGQPLPPHSEHYVLVNPDDKNERSSTNDNWCVLERAQADGALW